MPGTGSVGLGYLAAVPLNLAQGVVDVVDTDRQDRAAVQVAAAGKRAVGTRFLVLARAHQPVRLVTETGDLPAERITVEPGGPVRVIDGDLEVHDL
jgi:hypothetical protein